MGQPLKKVVEHYIGLAKTSSNPRGVLRHAANDFAKAAMDPQNKLASIQLKNMAMEFARAAHRPPTTDDFLDLLQETQMTIEEIGDADAMDVIARRREVHDERSMGEAPRVSISPVSFNDDVTLGRSGTFKFAPTSEEILNGIKQFDTLAFWQGTKKEAQAITIDTGLIASPVPPEIDVIATSIRPYGIIESGSDGNILKVKFDIGFGTRITVPANYVSVSAGMDPPQAGHPTTSALIGASIGCFAAPSMAPVLLTEYIDGLAPGIRSDFIPRPLKGVMLLPVQTDLALGETMTIEYYRLGGGTIMTRTFVIQSNTTWMQPVPLTDDVAFLKITHAGAGIRTFRLPFQLSL